MTALRTQPVERCPVCGGTGPTLYEQLRDRVFHVPGGWRLRRCGDCRSLWLDPRPIDADLPLAYACYFTHAARPASGVGPGVGDVGVVGGGRPGLKMTAAARLRVVRDIGSDAYIARHFDYPRPPQRWSPAAAWIVGRWPGRRLDAEFKVMRLSGARPGRLLDVGCGAGGIMAVLSQRGWDVRGLDFDPDAVAAARQRGLTVDTGELAAQCYPSGRFDAVTMSHSLEHVTDPAATLVEVRRILAPGGRLVIVTPNAASWLHRRYGPDWQPLEPPRHLQIFSRRALRDMAETAGFAPVDAVTTARSANGVARAAWKFRRHGHWDMASRPSLAERLAMEMVQQWEACKIHWDADAGEELVVTAVKP